MKTYYTAPDAEIVRFKAAEAIADEFAGTSTDLPDEDVDGEG